VAIDDLPRAQELLDQLVTRRWERCLSRFARLVNPWMRNNALNLHGYYWSMRQGEFATDVMFRDEKSLRELYPALVRQAIEVFSCSDTLRFLGRKLDGHFRGEIKVHSVQRLEGVRVKHWVDENSIKMYDKQGCVLRIETTINNPKRFKARRKATRKGRACMAWLPLRKGIADIPRRVEISRAANERYLEALAVVDLPTPAHKVLDSVQRRQAKDGRTYRALRPMTREECNLFKVLLRGEFLLQGVRNRDVRQALYPAAESSPQPRKQAAGRVTRWLRLLRAHGLLRKVSGTHYYRVTRRGHEVMTTALKLRQCSLFQLAA
jgi:hypothetical protein